jgi:4-hydroxy-3-polyprenylbenzoate decarboxylase/2,5-furandicarboxylate decarboxylase 1
MYSGPAPCQEVVIIGDDIDIREFPIPQYSPKDGGPYITPGITVSKDPETGIPDFGHYRFTPLSRNTFGGSFQPSHRFGKHIIKSRARGARQQAAIVLGCDPIIAYAAQVQATDTTNDWEVAGGLRGAPVELVKCKTVDVEVPATAEIIIEIEADASVNVMEGPLGEYTGYYTPPSEKPLIHITAITHRHNPIMQGLLTGKPVTDNHVLKQVPFEASIYRTLKRQFPTLEKVCIPPSGGVSFYTIIALQERFAGEARQAILATMSSNIRPKWVIAVEPDIDVYDPVDVNWALSFRVQPARDIFTVDHIPAGPSDPSVEENRVRTMRLFSAVGVDATRPFGKPFHEVADVPGWREYDVPELRGLSLVHG